MLSFVFSDFQAYFRGLQTFSVKGQTANILDFAGHNSTASNYSVLVL